jgi:HK97 family phage portal protein
MDLELRRLSADTWGAPLVKLRSNEALMKASAATPAVLGQVAGSTVWKTRDYAKYAREGYIQNTDAYACISLRAAALKGIRLFPYRDDTEGRPVEIESGPLVDLLKRPNPQMSCGDFLEAISIYMLSMGNCYIERVGPTDTGAPKELWLPRPDKIEIEKGDKVNPVKGYKYVADLNPSNQVQWPGDFIGKRGLVQKLMHLKFFHPIDDWYGLAPMEAAARSIDQNNSAQEWNISTLKNGARPTGALCIEGTLDRDQREELQEALNQHSGSGSVGKTFILEGGVGEYKPFAMTAAEMSWLEGQQMATRRICSVFRVPPQLIADETAKTYANYEEARRAFYLEAVLPDADFICEVLTNWLAPFYGDDIKIGYDRNDIEAIQEDRDVIHARAKESFDSGLITLNEAREMIGQKPIPGGDVLAVPTNVTITDVSKLKQVAAASVDQKINLPQPAQITGKPAFGKPKPGK